MVAMTVVRNAVFVPRAWICSIAILGDAFMITWMPFVVVRANAIGLQCTMEVSVRLANEAIGAIIAVAGVSWC